MQKLKVDPSPNQRVEDGSVEFEYPGGRKDWPGLYLRGDTYIGLNCYMGFIDEWIERGCEGEFPKFYWMMVKGLINHSEVIVTPK